MTGNDLPIITLIALFTFCSSFLLLYRLRKVCSGSFFEMVQIGLVYSVNMANSLVIASVED